MTHTKGYYPPSLAIGLQAEMHRLVTKPAHLWGPEDLELSGAFLARQMDAAPLRLFERHREAAELQMAGERNGYPEAVRSACNADLRTLRACERIERDLRRAGGAL